jgi:endonuclease YncB( thermonuclease family)
VEGAVSRTRARAALLLALALSRGEARSAPGAGAPERRLDRRRSDPAPRPAVVLDGSRRAVRWIDGDTLRILEGPAAGRSARIVGYNALESYGPVHRWGRWRPAELLANAREARRRAASGEWRCAAQGGEDAYGRLLVSCPDAARALVGGGLAMVFAVGAEPDPALVALQREAQARGAGMWSKGAPPLLPSSLHSADEPGLADGAYDRIVDTRTGRTEPRRHRSTYRACQEVCVGEGSDRACMTYVPFERRYRDRPSCLYAR